jgi:hypothetical protein
MVAKFMETFKEFPRAEARLVHYRGCAREDHRGQRVELIIVSWNEGATKSAIVDFRQHT